MSFPKLYLIPVADENLELIQFLNDGSEVAKETLPTVFVCEIISSNENRTDIKTEVEIWNERGELVDEYAKAVMLYSTP